MNEEETHSLLREVAEHQQSIERRLSAIEVAQHETWKKYEASDAAYREELSNYQQERTGLALGRTLGAVVRLLILLLLVYIAYRVS